MPISVVFSPGDQSQVVQVPLTCDTEVEGTETFTMTLSSINVTNSRLRFGTRRTAIGIIEDSTSMCFNIILCSVYCAFLYSNCQF